MLHIGPWPSRQLRNRSIRSKISCGRVEFSAIATSTGSRWVSNKYITRCHRRLELVGDRIAVWGSENQLQTGPRLSSQAEWERSAAIVRGTWGQYVAVCSVSNWPLTHNQYQPFRNPFEKKVWEVYFSEELSSFVHYCWLCFRMYMYTYSCIMWLYNKLSHNDSFWV